MIFKLATEEDLTHTDTNWLPDGANMWLLGLSDDEFEGYCLEYNKESLFSFIGVQILPPTDKWAPIVS